MGSCEIPLAFCCRSSLSQDSQVSYLSNSQVSYHPCSIPVLQPLFSILEYFSLSCSSQSIGYNLSTVPPHFFNLHSSLSNLISILRLIFLFLTYDLFLSNWNIFLSWKFCGFQHITINGKGTDGGYLHEDQPHISAYRSESKTVALKTSVLLEKKNKILSTAYKCKI